jgi:hypothetical protein
MLHAAVFVGKTPQLFLSPTQLQVTASTELADLGADPDSPEFVELVLAL